MGDAASGAASDVGGHTVVHAVGDAASDTGGDAVGDAVSDTGDDTVGVQDVLLPPVIQQSEDTTLPISVGELKDALAQIDKLSDEIRDKVDKSTADVDTRIADIHTFVQDSIKKINAKYDAHIEDSTKLHKSLQLMMDAMTKRYNSMENFITTSEKLLTVLRLKIDGGLADHAKRIDEYAKRFDKYDKRLEDQNGAITDFGEVFNDTEKSVSKLQAAMQKMEARMNAKIHECINLSLCM